MSNKLLLAAAAGAMLLAAPSLAAAATTHKVHTQSGTTAKAPMKAAPAKSASTKMAPATASTKTASGAAHTKAVHHHKMARTEHRNKTAENVSIRGHREVQALNALESAGYRQFNNLHASGANFVATAMKAGKSYDVTVKPTGQIEATKA